MPTQSIIAKVQSPDRIINQLQDNIANVVNPIASNLVINGLVLMRVPLVNGSNTINHLLGRNLIGWFLTRQRDVLVVVFDTQDSNPTPQLTLQLTTSADIVVDIYVF